MKTRALAFTAMTLLVSACGAQQFNSIATTQLSQAPGTLQIAPKVDVLLVEDDTGRIQDQYSQISQQSQNFLNTLDTEGWNYHFATVRLTSYGPITQAVASKQDPNWADASGGSLWQAPYPGAQMSLVDTLESSIFRTINYVPGLLQYAGEGSFLQPGDATNILNGQEPGLLNLSQVAGTGFSGTSFMRPDAVLAVVLVGTGNDTSYVNHCHRADGIVVPCESVTSTLCSSLAQAQPTGFPAFSATDPNRCASANLSLNYFKTQLQQLKPSAQQVKFYAAVGGNTNNWSYLCQGGMASPGIRYQQMAAALGGKSYDVCTQSLSSILPDIAQNLTTTALSFEKDYIVLKQQPDSNTIQVTKYVGGDPNNSVTIPMDPTNGWTYAGLLNNQPVIDYPIPMDYESGYMIQLHGTAKLSGADNASITYKTPTGSTVSQGQ